MTIKVETVWGLCIIDRTTQSGFSKFFYTELESLNALAAVPDTLDAFIYQYDLELAEGDTFAIWDNRV